MATHSVMRTPKSRGAIAAGRPPVLCVSENLAQVFTE
jgi:hypothetical protein